MRKYLAAVFLVAILEPAAAAAQGLGVTGGGNVGTGASVGTRGSGDAGASVGGQGSAGTSGTGASVGTRGSGDAGASVGGQGTAGTSGTGASVGTRGSGDAGTSVGGQGTAGTSGTGASVGTRGSGGTNVGTSGDASDGGSGVGQQNGTGDAAVTTGDGLVLPRILLPRGGNSIDGPEIEAIPGTPVAVVRACSEAIGVAAKPYGMESVRAKSAGSLRRMRQGAVSAPIAVRIHYARQGGAEIRQARIRCHLDATGKVIRLT
jgi:hypothetical protein